ncbi:MAG: MBL fold metallo-hydrolase [Candidatus Portnoybacteria bacterium]|nr:MBL fold metallo-hydrolase [Candidatus Portnoybacteria bacterium]
MKIQFHGGVRTVTGSKFLIKARATNKKEINVLFECGMTQGTKEAEEENYKDFPFDPKQIDYIFITHSHIDHIGLLPKICKDGFKGKIFTTPPTIDIAKLILEDSQNIMEMEARKEGKKPLYESADISKCLSLIEPINYGKKHKLEGETYFRFQNAGHILGSAIIEFWAEGKKIVFSGDLGNNPSPLLNPPKEIRQADYIVIESTYGDRNHEDKEERKERLENVIEDTFCEKGALMIPAFAIERSQELLYELNELVENNRVPRMPMFVDSPLAINVTEVYKKHSKFFNKKAIQSINYGDDLFKFPGLTLTKTSEESKSINRVAPPKMIIAGSGMSTGGRILFHEKIYLPDPRSCLLIINFQVENSRGRKLVEGAKNIEIFDENIPVRAKIKTIEGYSSHADKDGLYNWLCNFEKPVKQIFAVHGEMQASESLTQRIKDHLGIESTIPKKGQEFQI